MSSLSVSATSSGNVNPCDRFLELVNQGDVGLSTLKKYYRDHQGIDSNTLIRGVAPAVRNFQVQTVSYLYLDVMGHKPKFDMVHAVLEAAASEGNWQGLNYLLAITPLEHLPQESIDLALARAVEAAIPELGRTSQKACIACMAALTDGKRPPSDAAIEHALIGAVFMGNARSVEFLLSSERMFSWETLVRALKDAATQKNETMTIAIKKTIRDQRRMLNKIKNEQERESLISDYKAATEEVKSMLA